MKELERLGKKCSKAAEYFDPIIENCFVKMPPLTKKFVNDIGNNILQILKGDS